MKEIDHNPYERRHTNGIWWLAWTIIAVLWVGNWFFFEFDWQQIALGVGTGLVLASWSFEMTGGKVPESWKPRVNGRR